MKSHYALLFFTWLCHGLFAQTVDLKYYLPDIAYDQNIPTPKEFTGHEVGEWHITHDKLYFYAIKLAELSDRIEAVEHARSHEGRPLIHLVVTSPSNHDRIEDIRENHVNLTNTAISHDIDIENMPVVIYQGCSIHGNEASGSNAAMAMMYYLAAAQDERIQRLLDEAVILFDPSFNPDGLQRFSTWVNSHRGENLISDPVSREFDEAWPGGRTNHYWFDLNRDWLLLTHPESRGRIVTFHQWKPDILTDHHEMGSNSTFFFQPGIPARTNPNTPAINQELTYKIAEFHGRALDAIGSLYYTKESYDDFYYGKGSTYPDAHGCIGILFEQASSRGHLRETDHGLLSFPFTIRNQVTTMFSTQDAGISMRKELLEYKRNSFLEARTLAQQNPVKGYVFGDPKDPVRVSRFVDILLRHQIEVYRLQNDLTVQNRKFEGGKDFVVSLNQDQYRLAKSIFETVKTFQDSLFYDVSAWTMPLAFDIPYAAITGSLEHNLGALITESDITTGRVQGTENPYAYLIDWDQFNAPSLLQRLKAKGLIVKVSNEPFIIDVKGEAMSFDRGTLIIPVGNNQSLEAMALRNLLQDLSSELRVHVTGVATGLVLEGVNLGSRSSSAVEEVRPLMIIGDGVSSYDAGELWHHFDHVLGLTVPMVDARDFGRVRLSDYNLLIMPHGSYGPMNNRTEALKEWAQAGGNIVAIRGAIRWLKNREIINLDVVTEESDAGKVRESSFAQAQEERGALVTGGMIAQIRIDVTHPLFYGYNRDHLAVFHRGNDYYKPVSDIYSTPARYTDKPVLSGYLHKKNEGMMKGSAAVFTSRVGRGKVIGLADNPVFRGYWWGSAKLLANAIFFGAAM